ncbi:MAG: hypothetical protein AB9861_11120 [Methanosarcina sp.]
MEKLIKARPIKIVTLFLKLLESGTAAHYYKDLFKGLQMRGWKIEIYKGFGIYESSGFKKYYPQYQTGILRVL